MIEAGEIAYNAYCESRGWKSFTGEPLPQWKDVRPDIAQGWRLAAQAVEERKPETGPVLAVVAQTKQWRKDLDEVLQKIREGCTRGPDVMEAVRSSRERSVAITKLQEAIMWLGMDLKAMREDGVEGVENPYPQSYNPDSPKIEPTSDGLKL